MTMHHGYRVGPQPPAQSYFNRSVINAEMFGSGRKPSPPGSSTRSSPDELMGAAGKTES